MPTIQEFTELCNEAKCTWTRITQNGVSGWKVTSKVAGHEGNCIFLPSSGYRDGTGFRNLNSSFGYYWTITLCTESTFDAYYFYIDYYGGDYSHYSNRYYGYVVRPVCP